MMAVLTFVFTKIFKSSIRDFPLFLLCGMVPFNFFAMAWGSSTTSIVDNTGLIKRVPFPREIVPIASVLSTTVHLATQILLTVVFTLAYGKGVNINWLWLPVVWGLAVVFVCGLGLICSGLNVYLRDMRYIVESSLTVLYWLVPIFYDFSFIPAKYRDIYSLNPIAALVMAQRNIFLQARPPAESLLLKLSLSSVGMLVVGLIVFQKLKRRFYNYL
jgi:ABC-type polysaccharide/polyol phosphate export permease